jgi:ATP-dependent RNA helicase HelY
VFDGLDAPALAGLASCFAYEHRSQEAPPAPWFPSPDVRARYKRIEAMHKELEADEESAGLPTTRMPDPTFIPLAHAWASGQDLDDVLADEDLSPGDFVRVVKQLIDLLRQLGEIAPVPATAAAARQAAESLYRGVVSAGSAVVAPDDPGESAADPRAGARDPAAETVR